MSVFIAGEVGIILIILPVTDYDSNEQVPIQKTY